MTETLKSVPGVRPTAGRHNQLAKSDQYAANPGGVAVALALGMSWRLAVVVILPLLAGHAADNHWHKAPMWTVAGLAVAMAGMVLVVYGTLRELRAFTDGESAALRQSHKENKI